MEENKEDEVMIIKRKYTKLGLLDHNINISIGLSTNNIIIIKSSYYLLKLTLEYINSLVGANFYSIKDAFSFLEKKFDNDKFELREISNELIIIINNHDDIDNPNYIKLCLKENFENRNILIKELFKENSEIKTENLRLKQEIDYLKFKNDNDIVNLQMQINQFLNQMNSMNRMMNNINSNIMNQPNLFMNNSFQEKITIFFNKNMSFSFPKDALISTVIKQYKNMINANGSYGISYNGKIILNKNLTIEKAGITNFSNVTISPFVFNIMFENYRYTTKICCHCLKDELFSQLIERYRNKYGDNRKNIIFYEGMSKLDPALSIEQNNLINNSIIRLIP